MELPHSSENECTSDKYINMSEISNHNVGPKKQVQEEFKPFNLLCSIWLNDYLLRT